MSCALSITAPAISILCHNNGRGRCDAEGHGNSRWLIEADGQCREGRRMAATMDQCPECQGLMAKNSGFVLNFGVLEQLSSSEASKIIKGTAGEQPLCPICAGAHNTGHIGLLVSLAARRAAVKKFVESFLNGARVQHRHEFLNGVEWNWCDICGRCLSSEEEEEAGGIRRDNIVVCACKRCDEIAHQVIPDLPRVLFLDALEDILGRSLVRRSRQVAPAPIVQIAPRRSRFSSVVEIYQAIQTGEHLRPSCQSVAPGLSVCVVHANSTTLCKSQDGVANWAEMPAVFRKSDDSEKKGQGFGFCPRCHAELTAAGIVISRTLQEVVIEDIGGGTVHRDVVPFSRPAELCPATPARRQSSGPRPATVTKMEFVDPNAKLGGKKKSAGRETARDRIVAEAKRVFDVALALVDQQITVAESEIDRVEADIIKQEAEITAARNESDQELSELMIACAKDQLEDLLPLLAEKQATLATLKREREEMISAGNKPFRKVPQKARQSEKPKKSSDKSDEAEKPNSAGRNNGRKGKKGGKK